MDLAPWSGVDWRARLAGILLLATVLRLIGLGDEPLWIDEAFTWRWSRLSHGELWGSAAPFEYNPPLYFSVQRVWSFLGDSEWSMRSLSALLGVLACLLIYSLGKLLADRRTAEIAGLLAATQAVLVAYSQEARAYSLMTVLILLASWGAVRFFNSAGSSASSNIVSLLAYCLGTSGALFTHNASLGFLLLSNVAVATWWLCATDRSLKTLVYWVTANLIVIVSWLWWLPILWSQASDRLALGWIDQPSVSYATFTWLRLYAARYLEFAGRWGQIAMPLGVLIALGLWTAFRARRWPWLPIAFMALLWPVLLWLPGVFGESVWIERVLVPSLPFGILLMAYGLAHISRPRLRLILTVIVLATQSANVVAYYESTQKPPWDQLVATIAEQRIDDTAFVTVGDFVHGSFGYYADRNGLPKRDYVAQLQADLPEGYPDLRSFRRDYDSLRREDLKEALAPYRQIWVVFRKPATSDPTGVVLAELAKISTVTGHWQFELGLELFRLERDAGTQGAS